MFIPALAIAQGGAVTDTTRAIGMGSPSDPLRGNPAELSELAVAARRTQDSFERNRSTGLRFYNGGAYAKCDVLVGDICYSNNNGDVPPPDERNDARVDRMQLLDILDRAQRADPRDSWVSGMYVRYAIEAGQNDVAIAAASRCGGTAWWCNALQGLAYHVSSQPTQAEAAFKRALDAMAAAQRCIWTDLTPWLDTTMHAEYRATPCNERSSANATTFRMAKPLWMTEGNDISNEWYSRWTITRIYSIGRLPYDFGTIEGLTQIQVRYGWPVAWSMQAGLMFGGGARSIIGHEPVPSYDFMPTVRALENPLTATVTDWSVNNARALMRYSPRYASGFETVPNQLVRFRRGDTTILAGAWRLVRELEMGPGPYTAALITDASPGTETATTTVRNEDAGAYGALLTTLGTGPVLVSLEVFGARARRATRVRESVSPLKADTPISEILILQDGPDVEAPNLEDIANRAFGSTVTIRNVPVSIYWEMYGDISPTNPVTVSVSVQRTQVSLAQRLRSAIGLGKTTPVTVTYEDDGRQDGMPGRMTRFSLAGAIAGDYELKIKMERAGLADSTSVLLTLPDD